MFGIGNRVAPLALATLFCVPALAASGYHYALDPEASSVSAKVAFLGLASKTAQFPAVSGSISLTPSNLTAINLEVVLDARALRASDSVTLNRLKGPAFFDVANHPTIRFSGQTMTMTGTRAADVAGTLTARGVSRAQVLHVTFASDPAQMAGREAVALTGRMAINRRDYGMTAWGGIVGNKVDITIRTRMVPQ